MPKNQLIILIVAIVIIFGAILGWSLMQKSKLSPAGEGAEKETNEVLSLSAVVSSVDTGNNFLLVKPVNSDEELKVIISETSKLIKLEFPKEATSTFTPKQTEVKLSDFKAGDNIFIKVKENIAGKTEFDSVDFINIISPYLP